MFRTTVTDFQKLGIIETTVTLNPAFVLSQCSNPLLISFCGILRLSGTTVTPVTVLGVSQWSALISLCLNSYLVAFISASLQLLLGATLLHGNILGSSFR